ncbi:hypothetical protein [Tropicimonas sp. IMCC34043]|uniref:hypothetical protein n=1 Tax=Tropicimonas sp. IMCC34043 TaxID=2248760 RepID=UPI000E259C5F|nr:hypothetical protein [Tropicimonas sp. IMCC34043]
MSDFEDPEAESPGRMKSAMVATAAVAFVVAPLAVPFSGFDPALFPIPQVDPPAQPAGYAFAIWSVIYLWMLGHAVYGLGMRADDPRWDATRWPLILSLMLGAIWTAVASFSPTWAVILMALMLGGALASLRAAPEGLDRWWLRAPIALYAGWLTAAFFAGLAIVAAGNGILFGAVGWAWIALIAATALAVVVQYRLSGTPEYGLGVIWALVAIAVRNWGSDWGLVVLAVCAAVAVAIAWHRGRT